MFNPEIINHQNVSSYKGIGEHKNVDNANRIALCVAKVALYVLLGTVVSAAFTATTILACPPLLFASLPLSLSLTGYSAYKVWNTYMEFKGLGRIAPSTHNLIPKEKELSCPGLEEWDNTPMKCLNFKNCKQTFAFKKKLIESAEQEILISGSYCGRQAFDEILDAINKRMQEKPELKVYIITATRFVTDKDTFNSKNWTKITELTERYPDRFFTTFSFETFQANPSASGFKYVSNHTKLMLVDRKAMITGGSGIEDRWAYSTGLEAVSHTQETNFVNASIAKTFRDKDFLIFCNQEDKVNDTTIDRCVLEFYKLYTRWHHYSETERKDHVKIKQIRDARKKDLKPFQNFYQDLSSNQAQIDVDELLHDNDDVVTSEKIKVFMSGPEQKENAMERELINMIDNATKSVVINHMYFHPTLALRKALQRAVKRKIEIHILTNHYTENSPLSHRVFSPRSINNARQIARMEQTKQELVHLYYWDVEYSTNHQKYIIIDHQYLLCGSSNFGYKGFNSMSDYEHNLLIDSKKLCSALQEDFNLDLEHSKKYNAKNLRNLPKLKELVGTIIHNILEAKIG